MIMHTPILVQYWPKNWHHRGDNTSCPCCLRNTSHTTSSHHWCSAFSEYDSHSINVITIGNTTWSCLCLWVLCLTQKRRSMLCLLSTRPASDGADSNTSHVDRECTTQYVSTSRPQCWGCCCRWKSFPGDWSQGNRSFAEWVTLNLTCSVSG